jgi:glycosyltransferase involved in cell wall biosynthesis
MRGDEAMMDISVMLIAYNHEQYIRQALNSVMIQEDVPAFEIVVGEDRSTDDTRTVITEMVRAHPSKIRVQFGETNIGSTRNYIRTLRECRGNYVALLDGDDFWTDPGKLRKQADFLDKNPECAICFHDALVFYQDGDSEPRRYVPENQRSITSLADLLQSNFIPTCSVMFRNQLFSEVPDWYFQMKMADYPLHIFNAQYGMIGYLEEVMAVYRVHSGGVWGMSAFEKQLKADIQLFGELRNYLAPEYEADIHAATRKRLAGLALCLKEKALNLGSVEMGIEEITSTLNEIGADMQLPKAWVSQLLSSVYVDYAFIRFKQDKHEVSRDCLTKAIRLNPRWIGNRGVRAILLRTSLEGSRKHPKRIPPRSNIS